MENIGLETNFKEAFVKVVDFLNEADLPLELVYKNKKPATLPKDVDVAWDIVQKFYEQEDQREKETGEIVLY